MSDDNKHETNVETLAQYVHALRCFRRDRGYPSYAVISTAAKRAGEPYYSTATICRALSGRRLPKWSVVKAFLRGCEPDITQEELDGWLERWAAVAEQVRPAEGRFRKAPAEQVDAVNERRIRPAPGIQTGKKKDGYGGSPEPDPHQAFDENGAPPQVEECARCGALVVDKRAHSRWHLKVETALPPH
jgi:hypothetical protein